MAKGIDRLLAVMARLRDPERGCPWDREQTFATIAPYTIEEAYEVAEAIRREDWNSLVDELGDLLFQVVFHARMAEEAGHFDFAAVVEAIRDKMERRHPHVFGTTSTADAEAQSRAWEEHKARERGGDVFGGVALALPALKRAQKLQARVARVGLTGPIRNRRARKSWKNWASSTRRSIRARTPPSSKTSSVTSSSPSSTSHDT